MAVGTQCTAKMRNNFHEAILMWQWVLRVLPRCEITFMRPYQYGSGYSVHCKIRNKDGRNI